MFKRLNMAFFAYNFRKYCEGCLNRMGFIKESTQSSWWVTG